MKRTFGFVLVIFALTVFIATYFPLFKNEIEYRVLKTQDHKIEETKPLDSEFGIVIDNLGINSKVIKNVNPYDANIYQKALTQGVAHAEGTNLPGEDGNIFIFSHSSENFYEAVRYNSIFYLLPRLEIGDIITLYYKGNRFDYHVSEKKIVDSSDTKYLTSNSEKPQLTLMTCYPPGTNLKRFIIVAN
ncbi:MAG: sortase family protein [Candidatus Collierbacteria bacterium GW2011_GWC2_45_15]|uniref:Sortase family protein n=2 Tax=Candidatus Collieribacteriota TaxID=1752725 RepID=A0A0G1RFI1_9BACT|nr:MAG: sortase family protein [Candidatus Collierbacteria bacterium GW2011_GWC2_45_15]KKU28773.1 MAG: sortase family protein [Candidatus Collierbacteria bacterium GW2011_GWE1_46_18]